VTPSALGKSLGLITKGFVRGNPFGREAEAMGIRLPISVDGDKGRKAADGRVGVIIDKDIGAHRDDHRLHQVKPEKKLE